MKNTFLPSYETHLGKAYCCDCMDGMKTLESSSIQLILTSPPFALTFPKEYGNKSQIDYIDWFMPFATEFWRILKDDGSLVIDLGGSYIPDQPTRSLYQYELLIRLCKEIGFLLAEEFFHYNPARLPSPAEWVTVRRIRVKDSVNTVWWLSKTPYPKADNRNVLQTYSASMERRLKIEETERIVRPSGHNISTNFNQRLEGAIPSNLLAMSNTASNSEYIRKCKKAKAVIHPARFPEPFAEFFINFLTDAYDWVLDPFAGSNTTGYMAEQLQRRWLAFEMDESYMESSRLRFDEISTLPLF